jgi:hypothetical protein
MPKNATSRIQQDLRELGQKLGFVSVAEETLPWHAGGAHSPVYDVVWYLDMEKHFRLDGLEPLFANDGDLFARVKKLPFAGFEIEGASTSSKNQVGNFSNLYAGDFLFGFEIVNNIEANGENDTYRRGLKIKNYFTDTSENRNMFFLDNVELRRSLEKIKDRPCGKNLKEFKEDLRPRKPHGGDVTSIPMYEKIRPCIEETGLFVKQNYEPWIYGIQHEMLQEAESAVDRGNGRAEYASFLLRQSYYKDPYSDRLSFARSAQYDFYIPKIDTVLGFSAPDGFTDWLAALADSVQSNYAHFPLLYALKRKLIRGIEIPLVAIEFEGSVNKHLSGGIYNMSRNAYAGILVTTQPADSRVEFLKKEIGIKNVTSYLMEV